MKDNNVAGEGLAVVLKRKRPATWLGRRRAWYAEGDPPAQPPALRSAEAFASPATPPPDPKPEPKPEPTDEVPEWAKDPAKAYAEVQKVRQEAAKHRKDASDFEKRLAAIEAEKNKATEDKLKEQNEWKLLAEKKEGELNELRSRVMRMEIASELGLTPAQAKRLQGSTEAELREDAQSMLKEFGLDKPKPETAPAGEAAGDKPADAKPEPKPEPTPATPARSQRTAVAPGGQPVGETDDQRRARLYKDRPQETPLFNPKS